jgi:hypothetical protein
MTTHDTSQETRTMTITMDAAELRRIALAVETSAARDDARPVLADIRAKLSGVVCAPHSRVRGERRRYANTPFMSRKACYHLPSN